MPTQRDAHRVDVDRSPAAVALDALLREDPSAVVSALGPCAGLVPMPASLPLHGNDVFEGRWGIDLVSPDDHLVVIDAWARAEREPVVRVDVHLLADPDQLSAVHIFDVRAEHGAHIVVLQTHDADAVPKSAEARRATQRRTGHSKKSVMSVFLEVDDATTALLGYEASAMVGHSSVEFVHPDDVQRAIDDWLAMRAGQGAGRVRVRYRHADGRDIWVEVTNHNHLDDPDLGCVLSEMRDISAEMAQIEALQERERLLARLAEALPIGICHLRPDLEVVYVNEPLVALLGAVVDVESLVRDVPAGDRHHVQAALANALQGRPVTIEVGLVRDHDVRRCELTCRPLADDDGNIDGVIVCAADVTDRSRLRSELEHRASHDALTGCLNRAAAVVTLERALRDSAYVAVAYIDLDHFKAINDDLGHAAGDELLRVAAARLRGATRSSDQLARVGGDEFVVICSRTDAPIDPSALADRLTDAVNGDVTFAKQRMRLTASVGATSALAGELDAEAVLHRADTAMYARKHANRAMCSARNEPAGRVSADATR